MERIPVAGPWITKKEIDYVTDAIRTAWYADHYKYNKRFEETFAKYVGCAHAVSLPSATSGLHLALAAAGVGPGDEVIVPDVTWIASAAPVTYLGAAPVFVDIDRDTWCMSADAFEKAITTKTKAVIPVDLYGSMADYDRIVPIAEKTGVTVIEDAAEALGSEYHSLKAGRFGIASAFSFHGSKTLTTGEGGMLVTNDDQVWERVMFLRDHGRSPGDTLFVNKEVAFKYKMSALQAACGLGQIERIEELISRKREIFSWYEQCLNDVETVTLNAEPDGTINSYWMVTIILDKRLGMTGKEMKEKLLEREIDSRPFFRPLSSLPAFEYLGVSDACRRLNTYAYDIPQRGLNLPSGYNMTSDKVSYVCEQIKELIGRKL